MGVPSKRPFLTGDRSSRSRYWMQERQGSGAGEEGPLEKIYMELANDPLRNEGKRLLTKVSACSTGKQNSARTISRPKGCSESITAGRKSFRMTVS